MTLHVPTHHAGFASHRLLNDLVLAMALAVVLLLVIGIVATVRVNVAPPDQASERQSIVQFRADERLDWAAGLPTQGSQLIEFRAGERGPLP